MSSGRRHDGFTYLLCLIAVAGFGVALAGIVELWSHARQREKEAELLWIGNQFKEAIGAFYQRSPGSVKRYPEKLDELVEDRRFLHMQRYLRKIWTDPMTGKAQWGLVQSPQGGIMGVHSLSDGRPIRQIDSAASYSAWRFIYRPPDVKPSAGR